MNKTKSNSPSFRLRTRIGFPENLNSMKLIRLCVSFNYTSIHRVAAALAAFQSTQMFIRAMHIVTDRQPHNSQPRRTNSINQTIYDRKIYSCRDRMRSLNSFEQWSTGQQFSPARRWSTVAPGLTSSVGACVMDMYTFGRRPKRQESNNNVCGRAHTKR